ncbi:MAG: hypothetical protein K2X77_33870 [Candidatus Obscuribacterales bacterium]|jgi:hypothetical protein|nr:hypothetical protein [Candidatus Obscuribacterales bacterium]
MLEALMSKATKVVGLILVAFVVSLVCCIPLMLLWNWLVPPIFGFASVNLLQALGLSVLAEMLLTSYTHITVRKQ